MKKTKKKTSLSVKLLLAAVLVAALWLEYEPLITRYTEIMQLHGEIQPISPQQASGMLMRPEDGQPTLVYVYAGWCPPCKEVGHLLAGKINDGLFGGTNLLFMSLDEKRYDMARYIVNNGYSGLFTPYQLVGTPAEALQPLGAKDATGIPYVALFDGVGQLQFERAGSLNEAEMEHILSLLPQMSSVPQEP